MSFRSHRRPLLLLLFAFLGLALAPAADARRGVEPFSANGAGGSLASVDRYFVPARDGEALIAAADARTQAGGPPEFADPVPVSITPDTRGTWEILADGGRLWRLRIDAPGATDLNLGFTRYHLPPGAMLYVIAEGEDYYEGPYTWEDNESHGQLWLPVTPGAQAVVELYVPAAAKFEPELELAQIGYGFRDWFRRNGDFLRQGSCNNDVICPEGDPWRDQIQSEAVYSTGGSTFCSGQMLSNTAQDFRNFFLTANHCGINAGNAASLVVYWNFESPTCGALCCGSLSQNQTGAVHRVSGSASDFTLVELDDDPDPAFDVYYSGFDASGATPSACTAIHHPNTDEKAISFNTDPLTTTSYLGTAVPGNGTHWRVDQWEDGTTEPGSSGSGIWDPNQRLVGQLHGGYASCSSITSDWYGKLSISWDAGLSTYLDAGNTGQRIVDGSFAAATLRFVAQAGTDECPGSPGNVNGVWEPGETITVAVDIGATSAGFTNITGTLSSSTPGVTILDDTTTWPDLGPNASATSDAPHFRVSLDPSIACFSEVDFQLVVYATEGGPYNMAFSHEVGASLTPPGLPLAIPDGSGSATSNLSIPVAATLTDVDVRVVIQHTWVGDLEIELQSPQGTRITLLDRPGVPGSTYGCSNDDMDVQFDDETAYNLESHCAGSTPWYSGLASPASPLSVFDGQSAQGTWQLIVSDHAGADTGVIQHWELITTPVVSGTCEICPAATSVVTTLGSEPGGFFLAQNRPNPFTGRSEIRFSLVDDGRATLELFDVTGRLVTTLLDAPMARGTHAVSWDGRDAAGSAAASGIYFYRLTSGERSEMKRMSLVR